MLNQTYYIVLHCTYYTKINYKGVHYITHNTYLYMLYYALVTCSALHYFYNTIQWHIHYIFLVVNYLLLHLKILYFMLQEGSGGLRPPSFLLLWRAGGPLGSPDPYGPNWGGLRHPLPLPNRPLGGVI